MSHKSIAVVAATQIEAHTLAEHLQQHADLAGIARSRGIGISFTALTCNQPWPEQPFDELHWLCTHAQMPTPARDITASAAIVHVHYLTGTQPPLHPGTRTYLWRNMDELARFWASFHRAQALRSAPGLNWHDYESANFSAFIGQTATGWAATRIAAVMALLSDVPPELRREVKEAVLLIEANQTLTLGDYVSLCSLLDDALNSAVASMVLATEGYEGYGLKLLLLG